MDTEGSGCGGVRGTGRNMSVSHIQVIEFLLIPCHHGHVPPQPRHKYMILK